MYVSISMYVCMYVCIGHSDLVTASNKSASSQSKISSDRKTYSINAFIRKECMYVPAFQSVRVSFSFLQLQWNCLCYAHLTEIVEGFGLGCRSEVRKYYFLCLALQVFAVVSICRSENGTAIADGQIAT